MSASSLSAKARRLPFEPLETEVSMRLVWAGVPVTMESVARYLGTDATQVKRYRKMGIHVFKADDLAVHALGMHPFNVWGDLWSGVPDCCPDSGGRPHGGARVVS